MFPWQIEYHESKSAAAAGSDDYNVGANGNDDVDTEQTGHQYDSLHQQENQMNESDLERHFANQGRQKDFFLFVSLVPACS